MSWIDCRISLEENERWTLNFSFSFSLSVQQEGR
uniref:Uncharacterized protein n=1 Tax=Anguilla anguilla TaxID=7936 RepID=A0A0E9QKC7_ANGAN